MRFHCQCEYGTSELGSSSGEHSKGIRDCLDRDGDSVVHLSINTDPALCVAVGLQYQVRGREGEQRKWYRWTTQSF